MSDDLSLFGDDDPAPAAEPAPRAAAPVADWQVDLLRTALDKRGLTSLAERQQTVELHAGRSLGSLRELTSEEAFTVLTALGGTADRSSAGSLWDDREDDTWIDRL
ncbi:MAG TPA: hypothetical protein VGE77_00190 [Nocardioides sp.]